MPKNDDKLKCSFCGKTQDQVKKLIAGPEVYICDECVELCNEILDEEFFEAKDKESNGSEQSPEKGEKPIPKPHEIKEYLDQYIVGQDDAKKVLSVAVYNHYKRLKHNKEAGKDNVEIQKSNILLVGPTGSGKTLLAQTLAKMLDVPFAVADATTLTEAGYVGDDVENILLRLYQNAEFDSAKAERGIIYIDEIDKISRKSENTSITRDVSGEGVQNSLLKIIEGNIVNVPPQGGRKHPYQEYLKFDTSKVLFICAGSFEGLDKVKNNVVGFENTTQKDQNLIDTRKLQKFGIIPEILGRLPVITRLEPLTLEDLEKILTLPKKAITKEYERLFKSDNIHLIFSESAIKEIAKKAFDEGTGARALRKIIEERMLDVMFELPYNNEINQI